MTRHTRSVALAAVLASLAATAVATAGPGAAATRAKPYDFNGDHRADVALGIPLWDVPGVRDAGAALTMPGTARGLGTGESVRLQPGPGAPTDIGWGRSVVSADFDRDGFADLAVGAPGDAFESTPSGDSRTGSVTIFRGTRSGLSSTPVTRVLHGTHGGFGTSLTAADFDSDGWIDLAVGSPFDDPLPESDFGSGAVVVLHGGAAGFSLDRSHTVARPHRADALFGSVLAAGDVNRDGHPDLVEGASGGNFFIDDPAAVGHTNYLAGTATGPRVARTIGGRAAAIAVGDVTGDGFADIVIGNPVLKPFTEDAKEPTGRVRLVGGSAAGPRAGSTVISQATAGVPGADEVGDRFGTAVALSDLDHDGRLDAVIGSPGEDRGRGRVTVVRGARTGFARTGNWTVDQASRGVPGASERQDRFGAALSVLDVDGNGRRDLVIGAPGENRGAGSVTVLRVKGRSYVAAGARAVTAASLGQHPGAEAGLGSVIGR